MYQFAVESEDELCWFLKSESCGAVVKQLTNILTPDILRHLQLVTHSKHQQALLHVQHKPTTTRHHKVNAFSTWRSHVE